LNRLITLNGTLSQKIKTLNWVDFLNSSAVLSVGIAAARALALAFSLLLARAFVPEDFGYVQYMITLATLFAIGTQAFTQHVLARSVARYKTDPQHLDEQLSNHWIVLSVLYLGTLAVTVPLLVLTNRFNYGVFIVFTGSTLFYTYYGLSRGFMSNFKLLVAYVGSNLVQLIATVALIVLPGSKSTFLALFIYGMSYVPPIVALLIFAPFPFNFKLTRPSRAIIFPLIATSMPIWISQICYIVLTVVDVLFLEQYHGTDEVGVYSLSKTLCMVFAFSQMAINTTLMPKIAALPKDQHAPLLKRAVVANTAVNFVFLVIFAVTYNWVVENIFSPQYIMPIHIPIAVALACIGMSTHSVLSALYVGSYRARVETISLIAGVVVAIVVGLLIVPSQGLLGAALTFLSAAGASLVVLIVLGQSSRSPAAAAVRLNTGE
jgi:O-antigen/teichoic acid export membrane protein